VILYVNGDSHSAAAEAVNPYAFAEDDPLYWALGRQPHPDNERVSYGCELANRMYAILHCDAESGSSNDRMIRVTREYLTQEKPDLIVIGWSTWEREEYLHDGVYYQLHGGHINRDWPNAVREYYKEYIARYDFISTIKRNHAMIHAFHTELQDQKIPHYFFNTFAPYWHEEPKQWHDSYLEPYSKPFTFWYWLQEKGFSTVREGSYHYGPKAHEAWADLLWLNIPK
jgi:hypothetical protein